MKAERDEAPGTELNIVFCCRDSVVGCYIAHKLDEEDMLDAIVVESGARARRKKIRRVIRKTSWYRYPELALNIGALWLYNSIKHAYLSRRLFRLNAAFPSNIPSFRVDSVNAESAQAYISRFKPDVLMVHGTEILSEKTLNLPALYAFNIHGGIVPEYRNVHSDFWAYIRKDYHKLGVSVLHLTPGIDSGDIALQETVGYESGDSLLTVNERMARLAVKLGKQVCRLAQHGDVPSVPQKEQNAGFYRTPSAIDFVRLIVGS